MGSESGNLIREGVEKVNGCLERCTRCGKIASQIINHECESSGSFYENVSEDLRPLDEGILTNRTGVKAYAYHEIGDNGEPLCGGGRGDASRMMVRSRQWARDRGRSPCQTCLRIQEV